MKIEEMSIGKITPKGQYEIDFDSDVNKKKEKIEERDSSGRTREEAAIYFKVMNPKQLYFNQEKKEWMMGNITLEEWDKEMKRLDEPGDDDYLYGRK